MYPKLRRLLFLGLSILFILPSQAQNRRQTFEEIGRTIEQKGEELVRTIEYYTRRLAYNPSYAPFYNNRAAIYFDQGAYRQAIQDYTQAVRHYQPDNRSRLARVHYKRGLCYYILGDYDQAVEDFSTAITYRPDVPDSYYFRGKIKTLIYGDSYLAEGDLRAVIEHSQYPSIQSAFAHYFLGDLNKAGLETKKILANTHQSDGENYALVMYNLAGLQALIGNRYEALRNLRTALDYGYSQMEWLRRDINFRSLANDAEFQALLKRHQVHYGIQMEEEVGRGPQTPATNPLLTSRDLRYEDANGNSQLDVGEKSYIVVEITNVSNRTLRNVRAQIKEVSGQDGIRLDPDYLVGDLSSGTRRQVRFWVNGTDYLRPGEARFEILFNVGYVPGLINPTPAPLLLTVPTRAVSPPSLDIVDHRFGSELGGEFRVGEPITLNLAVQNTGNGEAEAVSVSFELPDNVYAVGEKTQSLGTLGPGASQVSTFEFFASNRYKELDLPVVVNIKDGSGRYRKRQTLFVDLEGPLEVEKEVVVAPSPVATPSNTIKLISDVDRDLPRTTNQNPNAVAVVIGNRDYLNRDVPPVDYALNDAAAMRKYLVEVYGFDENNILYLNNATQADFNGIFGTKEDHRARLYNLVKPGESDVFVFYSGHGAPDLETEAAYIVPVNCDPSLVKFNGYAMSTLYDNLAKIPYRNLTVVIDACFSGASDRGTLIPRASIVRIKPQQNSIFDDPRAMVFTSATGSQIASWYPEQAHGLFTYYFLKGLQGAANTDRSRQLTLGEMEAYLLQEVPYMARRMNNRVQTPEIYGRGERGLLDY